MMGKRCFECGHWTGQFPHRITGYCSIKKEPKKADDEVCEEHKHRVTDDIELSNTAPVV